MKTVREISGVYFRFQNPETKRFENRVFEDLPEDEQRKILSNNDHQWTIELAIILANKLYEVCEQFDISTVKSDES